MSILRRNLDMIYIPRIISTELQKTKKSILLLGPRQTGKSTLIQNLKPELTINLANQQEYLSFASQPNLLENLILQKKSKTIFIDEVQRIPSLLNTIQYLIDKSSKLKFYLSGSSARKLRRGNANLLPGRVLTYFLSPISVEELNFDFQLNKLLSYGSMPGILNEMDIKPKKQLLLSYSATYLKEEVQAEALTKNIEGFSRFLFVAAAKNSQFVDFSKIASQAFITQKTASRFFDILEDTLIVTRVNSYAKTDLRRLIQHPKFYFFDTGVVNALLGNFQVSADRVGELFETFIVNQIRSLFTNRTTDVRMSTYRTDGGAEVDLILELEGATLAIEIKASKNIGKSDLRGLRSFSEICSQKHSKLLIYLGDYPLRLEDVDVLPVAEAFRYIINWIES